ncbi:sigma-54 interaction domain-containing protein [Thiosocius teredinicola]|uniref:sigma-54 interaction domain-containing protein n=1 Tax=Thiosocius teredinicola TaxID=1973002 RepID=UPI000990BD41
MRKFVRRGSIAQGLGTVLEKIEILRASLRWAARTNEVDVAKLLKQCNELRDEAVEQLRKDRLFTATDGDGDKPEPLRKPVDEAKSSAAERRKALDERQFVFEGVFGDSPELLDAMEIAERAAPTELPVLIQGESGTGKELLAKVVHANGDRSDKPFVSVNCGAIPENLLESELFGHKKGAFTGASGDRKGKFESAHTGTIFLDEVGELPLQGQVKLLRALQSSEIQRVGSDQPITVDTRVVAATNRDLLEMSRRGEFREDLYYRLSVIQVTIPPLRDRRDEIPLLLEFFLEEATEKLKREVLRLSPRLHAFLMNYHYPGNIRELRNIIFRLACLADDTADVPHLPKHVLEEQPGQIPMGDVLSDSPQSLSDVKKAASDAAERLYLEQALSEVNGKVTEVAKNLSMNRTHVQTLLKKHGISSKSFKRTKTS